MRKLPRPRKSVLFFAANAGIAVVCAVLADLMQWPAALTGLFCAGLGMLLPISRLWRERILANQRQKQTQDFVQRLLDVIPEPVYVKDNQGRYIVINKAFAQRRKQNVEAILGRTATELAPDAETVRLVTSEDQRVLAGATVYKEDCIHNPTTGENQYRIVTKGSCLNAEGQQVIIGANFDITSMRLAEQQLEAALARQTAIAKNTQAFIQHILDVIPYPMYVKDAQSRYLIVNQAIVDGSGIPREELLGHSVLELAPTTQQARTSIDEDRCVLAGKPLRKEEQGLHPITREPYFQEVIKGTCRDTQGAPVIVGVNIDITALRNSELQLSAALLQLREHHQHTLDFVQRVLDLLPYPVYVKDARSRYLMVNDAMARDHFVRRDELINSTGLNAATSPEQARALFAEDGEVLSGHRILREDHTTHPVSGRETFRIIAKGTCVNALGDPVIVGASIDLTDLRLAERELKAAFKREVDLRERTQEFIQRLIDVIPDPVYVKKAGSQYILINKAFCDFHQQRREDLLAAQIQLGTPETRDISSQEDQAVLDGGEVLKETHTTQQATGAEVFRVVCKRRSVYVDGTPVVIGIDHIITQWRLAERELQRLAREDALTGLSNRRHFQNEALNALSRAKRYREPVSLLMLDIDHFKSVNDAWGHQTGDEVLVETVRRLRNALRETDIPARWGGEEFIILLQHTPQDEARLAAERLRQQVAAEAMTTSQTPLNITISIGVAQWQADETLDQLISRADMSLYQAKEAGRNRVGA